MQRHRRVIYKGPGPSGTVDNTSENQMSPVPVDIVFFKYRKKPFFKPCSLEFGFNDTVFGSVRKHPGICLGSHHKGEGPQKYGLSCTGLASNNDQTLRKNNFQRVYQYKILDLEP